MSNNFINIEKDIQKFWTISKIFEKSLNKNSGNDKFIFYDGPPFATGKPHYGHILAGKIKDVVCRHQQFKGKYVKRLAGFDCHGLPIDHEIDKKLDIKNYQGILDFGIKKYNDECRGIVLRCVDDWKSTMSRMARWIDIDGGYKTMDKSYMESVWAVFSKIWKKNLVYKGFKVMPYSTACSTPLSNFEAKSNYKSICEESIFVEFEDVTHKWIYLVWTTTPWTLPSNMALCVNENLEYTVVGLSNEDGTTKYYIVASDLIKTIFGEGKKKKLPDNIDIGTKFKGKDFIGNEYIPILDYYKDDIDYKYRILADDYVKDSSGTGIVHLAPSFGDDDFRVCLENGIISKSGKNMRCPVDKNGRFTNKIFDLAGINVKEADKIIISSLKETKKLFKRVNSFHDVPFCWRSDTPLIYKAIDSWFIDVTKIKSDLLLNNIKTNWVPDYIKEKRFHNWLEDAKDWGFSRTRVWGCPIPIYTNSENSEYYCVSSVQELETLAGLDPGSIKDLHRDSIDHISIKSPNTGNILTRIEDVFDCWFESGSMPFAHQHYPFEKSFDFPADFIAEGVDQTRGWFYTLLVLSTILKNQPAFKNVIVNGLVLAQDGKKMSKRLKNYPDPINVIDKYGADSLGLYLLCSPVVKAETLSFNENGVFDIYKSVLIPFQNSFTFYHEQKMKYQDKYFDKMNYQMDMSKVFLDSYWGDFEIYDKWILYKFNQFKSLFLRDLDNYTLYNCKIHIMKFIEELNNQYIKLNKFRSKNASSEQSHKSFFITLGIIIYNLSITLSSVTPFFSEHLYQKVKNGFKDLSEESVHLLTYQSALYKDIAFDKRFSYIDQLHKIIDSVRSIRAQNKISFKMPIKDILVCVEDHLKLSENLNFIIDHLTSESNVLNVNFDDINKYSKIALTYNKAAIGTEFRSKAKYVYSQLKNLDEHFIKNSILADDCLELAEGITLNKNHFNVVREVKEIENYIYHLTDNNLIVYLNTGIFVDTLTLYRSKLLITAVQQFRKELQFKPWDKINVNYVTTDNEFNIVFAKHKDDINMAVSNPVYMNSKLDIFNPQKSNNKIYETIFDSGYTPVKIQITKN